MATHLMTVGKSRIAGLARETALLAAALLWAAGPASATQPLHTGEIDEYHRDAGLASRLERVQAVGDHEAAPGLAQAADAPTCRTLDDCNNIHTMVCGGYPWWFAESEDFVFGDSAARTPAIPDGELRYILIPVTGPVRLKYSWKVSSEQDHDFLRFLVDYAPVYEISGEHDWERVEYWVPAGTHNLVWVYEKDVAGSAGLDTAWLDWVTQERISGRVFDALNGEGIGGVIVNAYDVDKRIVASTLTAGDGTYGLPWDGVGQVFVGASESASAGVGSVYPGIACAECDPRAGTPLQLNGQPELAGIDLALERGGWLAGVVTDATTGDPLPGVSVEVVDLRGATVGWGEAGPLGAYELRGLPQGVYHARVWTWAHPEYADQAYGGIPCSRQACPIGESVPVLVNAGRMGPNVNFQLSVGGWISGTVLDSATGAPVEGTTVEIFDLAGQPAGETTTDGAGAFRSNGLPTGSYYVAATSAPGYVPEMYGQRDYPWDPQYFPDSPRVDVTLGEETPGIDISMSRGGRITGTIEFDPWKQPTAVTIDVFDSEGKLRGRATSDEWSGAYETSGLPDGIYYVRTRNALGYVDALFGYGRCTGCDPRDGTPVVIGGGQDAVDVSFLLLDDGGVMAGYLRNADTGASITNAAVNIFDHAGRFVTRAKTDNRGFYQLDTLLREGPYSIVTGTQSTYIDAIYGGSFCPGATTYSGFVPSCGLESGVPVWVQSAEVERDIDIPLHVGGRIAGTVTGVLGPAARERIEIHSSNGDWLTRPTTDAEGGYQSDGLPSGTYHASITMTALHGSYAYGGLVCPGSTCSPTASLPITVTSNATTDGIAFDLGMPRRLSISKSGVGSGTVTSTPGGLACGSQCSAQYVDGTRIDLVAQANAGSRLVGWSGGGCSGSGPCSVLLSGGDTTVTAAFGRPQLHINDVAITEGDSGEKQIQFTITMDE